MVLAVVLWKVVDFYQISRMYVLASYFHSIMYVSVWVPMGTVVPLKHLLMVLLGGHTIYWAVELSPYFPVPLVVFPLVLIRLLYLSGWKEVGRVFGMGRGRESERGRPSTARPEAGRAEEERVRYLCPRCRRLAGNAAGRPR